MVSKTKTPVKPNKQPDNEAAKQTDEKTNHPLHGDIEQTDHLLRIVRTQYITRKRVKKTASKENPENLRALKDLEHLIIKSQREDGFTQSTLRLLKGPNPELSNSPSNNKT